METKKAQRKEAVLRASGGVELFCVKDLAGSPRAAVVVAHGLAEHHGRYDYFTGALNSSGYSEKKLARGENCRGKNTFWPWTRARPVAGPFFSTERATSLQRPGESSSRFTPGPTGSSTSYRPGMAKDMYGTDRFYQRRGGKFTAFRNFSF